ncbi:MAG: ABC transporter ATP-binding protein [Rhodobacteraceae bacterium]|nr:ABC transporter ATP-binding protein [Paracoccaceae bacterium]
MNDPILTARGIGKSYNLGKPNEITVLKDVDLNMKHGEVVGLLAPSGAGKSTLLFILGLLESFDKGSLEINGKDVTKTSDSARTQVRRKEVGIVYQFHHLLPEFNALENVMIPQLANGIAKSSAREHAGKLLKRVGLSDRINHRPSELSGGEQQRVAICRSLANSPNLLLADEPTGNLDVDNSQQVFEVIKELVKVSGISALIATHNLSLAEQMDRVVCLENGVLVE